MFADLTGDQTFKSACSAIIFSNLPYATQPASAFGSGLTFTYAAASQAWGVSGDGLNLSFGPADIDTTATGSTKVYAKPGLGGWTDRLLIISSLRDYGRVISLQTFPPGSGSPRTYYCVIGVQTQTTDIPPDPVVSFTVRVSGALYDFTSLGAPSVASLSLQPSTATLDVNLATLKVKSTLHLIGMRSDGVTTVDLGTYDGTGDIDPVTGSVTGSWSSPGRDVFAYFGGTFFGPQGKEVALSYNMSSRISGQPNGAVSAGWITGSH